MLMVIYDNTIARPCRLLWWAADWNSDLIVSTRADDGRKYLPLFTVVVPTGPALVAAEQDGVKTVAKGPDHQTST